jgi:hypothetical protein
VWPHREREAPWRCVLFGAVPVEGVDEAPEVPALRDGAVMPGALVCRACSCRTPVSILGLCADCWVFESDVPPEPRDLRWPVWLEGEYREYAGMLDFEREGR